jgi:hypothetical protein
MLVQIKKEVTFPTINIGIRIAGTADTKPRSKYSNSLKFCTNTKITMSSSKKGHGENKADLANP